MHPAFIVIDPQNDFFRDSNPNFAAFLRTVPRINHIIDVFHQRGWPVIFIQHVSAEKPHGSHAWEIYHEFQSSAQDLTIDKSSSCAFFETELHSRLQAAGVDVLLVAGYLTERCVLETVQSALLLGYRVRVLKGGTANLTGVPSS